MAKLSAHGRVVYERRLLQQHERLMEDGRWLINQGRGWKLGKKEPPPDRERIAELQQLQTELLNKRPALRSLLSWLQTNSPLSIRWRLFSACELMPDDLDGIHSLLSDEENGVSRYSLCDIQEFIKLHRLTFEEHQDQRAAAREASQAKQ